MTQHSVFYSLFFKEHLYTIVKIKTKISALPSICRVCTSHNETHMNECGKTYTQHFHLKEFFYVN